MDRGDGVKPQESEFEPSRIDHPNDEVRLRWGGPSRAKLTQGHVCVGGLDTNDEEEAEANTTIADTWTIEQA